nr:unnamed protein product [Callosobruchus chinensis]
MVCAILLLSFCLTVYSYQPRRWCKVKELLIQHKIFNQHVVDQLLLDSTVGKAYFKLYCPNVKRMEKVFARHPNARTFLAICSNWLAFIDKILNSCEEESRYTKYTLLKNSLRLLIEEIPTNEADSHKNIGFNCAHRFPLRNEDMTFKTLFDFEVIKAMHLFFSLSYNRIQKCSSTNRH